MQYEGIRDEHLAVRTAARHLRRLAHGRDRDLRPAGAEASCSACSPTTSSKIAVGGAQYSVLCREDGGVLDDLFTYRLGARPLPDGHQRRQPREATSPGSSEHAGGLRRRPSTTRSTATRCSPSRARARARSCRRSPTAPLPAAHDRRAARAGRRTRRSSAARATPARTASSCCSTPTTRRAVWDALVAPRRRARRPGRARHAAPRGLLPPLRQRPHGGARPDRGRPRLVLQGGHGLHRRRRRPRRRARPARPRSSCRSRSTAPASRARATRSSAAAR